MPTSPGLPPRRTLLLIGFCIYVASTLISQATMSIGAAILAFTILLQPAALIRGWAEGWQNKSFRRYVGASSALIAAIALSLGVALLSPLEWGGQTIHAAFWT